MNLYLQKILLLLLLLFQASSFCAESEESIQFIPSKPEFLSPDLGSDFLIAKLVHPLSGQLCLHTKDLEIKGAQSLVLNRIYLPPTIFTTFDEDPYRNQYLLLKQFKSTYGVDKGFTSFPHLFLKIALRGNRYEGQCRLPNGNTLDFFVRNHQLFINNEEGLTNVSTETPSAKYDPRNIQIEVTPPHVVLKMPDGTHFHYRSPRSNCFYHLEKERLPNGKILKYTYDQPAILTKIESYDPKMRYLYAALQVQKTSYSETYKSNTKQQASYRFETPSYPFTFSHKTKWQKRRYQEIVILPPHLTSVHAASRYPETIGYNQKCALDFFSSKSLNFRCKYSSSPYQKVQSISLPTGENNAWKKHCKIAYKPSVGITEVEFQDNSRIVYEYNKNFLLKKISWLSSIGTLLKEKRYQWNPNGWLRSITLSDGENTKWEKTFAYDSLGNPILETLSGQFSSDRWETSSTKRVFSSDGHNNLLEETKEDGPTIRYQYLPKTNLPTAKFTLDQEGIRIREFFTYDDCHNLIQKILDDGSSENPSDVSTVQERIVTKYSLRQSPPFLHLPQQVATFYEEDGTLILIKKITLHYDQWGNVGQEDHYDAQENFLYSLYRTYDEEGNLLSETNPIGQEAKHTYDSKGNPIASSSFSGRILTKRSYDALNRLTAVEKVGDDGNQAKESYRYDFLNRIKQKADHLDNTTVYEYPYFYFHPKRIQHPFSRQQKITANRINSFGEIVEDVDSKGNSKTIIPNCLGQPLKIIYGDNLCETFSYDKQGRVLSHTDLDGMTTRYSYDVFGRVLLESKEFSGKKLSEKTFAYSAFHCLRQTDEEGIETLYSYDTAGRLIQKDCAGSTTQYRYDSLGRICQKVRCNEQQTQIIEYSYNLLDQPLTEIITDQKGAPLSSIRYAYDQDGNSINILRGEALEKNVTYDAFARPIMIQEGNYDPVTIEYVEVPASSNRGSLLQKKIIHPNQTATLLNYDIFHQLLEKQVLNPQNQTLLHQEFFYDSNHNLTKQKDHVYEQTQKLKTIEQCWEYDSFDHLQKEIKASGSPHEQITHFQYSPTGCLLTKTLPSGVTLFMTYTPLGFLQSFRSDDDAINRLFSYNKRGQLIEAQDLTHNIILRRTLDPFGNLLAETINDVVTLQKNYDALHRPQTLILPDQSEINYHYDALYLRQISRLDSQKNLLYTHEFTSYDLSGSLIQETLSHDFGNIYYSYDSKGNIAQIRSSYLKQNARYDLEGNLTLIEEPTSAINFSYDPLSQLIQEPGHFYCFSSRHHCLSHNNSKHTFNSLDQQNSDEIHNLKYDANGNLIQKDTAQKQARYVFDSLNQLIQASIVTPKEETHCKYIYDPLGRLFKKESRHQTEYYLYDGDAEIASLDEEGEMKTLRVLKQTPHGESALIEINQKPYIPLYDLTHQIRYLFSPTSPTPIHEYHFTAFGIPLHQVQSPYNPYQYASKRLDPDTHLIYFGKRYYDPGLCFWLSPDPIPTENNPYHYLYNNPFTYIDPDGQFAFAIPLLIWGAEIAAPAITSIAAPLFYGAAAGAIAYGGYKLVDHLNTSLEQARPFENPLIQIPQTFTFEKTDILTEKRSTHPEPDSKAEGYPHSIIEEQGRGGQYTTHNGDGTFKQYRGSGKAHGNIPRPNIKENYLHDTPKGKMPGRSKIRKPYSHEIPKY